MTSHGTSAHGTSALPAQAEQFQGRPAGLVTRGLAAVVDVAVVAIAMLISYIGVSAARFAWSPRSFSFPAPSGLLTLAVASGTAITYLAVGWWIAGRTYGSALMGLRVVSRDGRHLRFLPAVLRGAVCTLFPISLVWCAFDGQGRGVQDLLVRSRVIYDWRRER